MNPWIEPSRTSLTSPYRSRSLPARDERFDPLHPLRGGTRHADEGRNDAKRIPVVRGRRDLTRDRLLGKLVREVGRGGDPRDLRRAGEAPQAPRVAVREAPVAAGRPVEHRPQHRSLKLARRLALRVLHHPHDVRVPADAGPAHELAVRIDDVAALVEDEDRAGRRHPVEVGGDHPPPTEEEGVEPPGEQRLVGVGERPLRLLEPSDHLVDGLEPGVHHPVGIRPVVEADVGLVPAGPLAAVAVAFHQARQDDLVREAIVDLVRAPARELLDGPGAEDPAVAHRDVARLRPANVHGDDLAGGIDGDHGPS